MPNLDGTGPNGQGPKTGKQRGKCESAQPVMGRGRGQGLRPCLRGRRNWNPVSVNKE